MYASWKDDLPNQVFLSFWGMRRAPYKSSCIQEDAVSCTLRMSPWDPPKASCRGQQPRWRKGWRQCSVPAYSQHSVSMYHAIQTGPKKFPLRSCGMSYIRTILPRVWSSLCTWNVAAFTTFGSFSYVILYRIQRSAISADVVSLAKTKSCFRALTFWHHLGPQIVHSDLVHSCQLTIIYLHRPSQNPEQAFASFRHLGFSRIFSTSLSPKSISKDTCTLAQLSTDLLVQLPSVFGN